MIIKIFPFSLNFLFFVFFSLMIGYLFDVDIKVRVYFTNSLWFYIIIVTLYFLNIFTIFLSFLTILFLVWFFLFILFGLIWLFLFYSWLIVLSHVHSLLHFSINFSLFTTCVHSLYNSVSEVHENEISSRFFSLATLLLYHHRFSFVSPWNLNNLAYFG